MIFFSFTKYYQIEIIILKFQVTSQVKGLCFEQVGQDKSMSVPLVRVKAKALT